MITVSFAQTPFAIRSSDRIAISSDGNAMDPDEIFGYAMNYAIIWAFGMEKQLVHCQINNLLASTNNQASYDQMMESGQARNIFPGFNPSIQFDCVTDWAGAVADFKTKAEQGSENSILYFLLNGPMEMAWRSINAVAPEKRKFIHCISHSTWNETYTNNSGLSHNWASLKSSFSGTGVLFTDITDQNINFYSGADSWNFLNDMPETSILPQSTWTWLRGRDWKGNGDCSEAGTTWFLLTRMQKGRSTDIEACLKNPPRHLVPSYTIIVNSPNAYFTLNPNGGIYLDGTAVTVTATPYPEFTFSSWSGDLSGTVNPETIIMDRNKNISTICTEIPPNVGMLGAWIQGKTHEIESGLNRALIVLVHGEHSASFSAKRVAYGNQVMTKISEKLFDKNGSRSYIGAFILDESKIAAATSSTIAVQWSIKPTTGTAITSGFLSNVDQNALVGASAFNGANSVSTIATTPLATNAGDMVVVAGTAANNGTYSLQDGYIKVIEIASAAWGDGVAGLKSATGSNETPTLTQSKAMRQTIIGFVVRRKVLALPKFSVDKVQTPVDHNQQIIAFGKRSVSFTLPAAGEYTISIYNLAGALVMKNLNGSGRQGKNTVMLSKTLQANQNYIFRVCSGNKVTTQKVLLLSK